MRISIKKIKEIVIALLLSILAVVNASPHISFLGYQRQLYLILLFLCLMWSFIKSLFSKRIKKEYILRIIVVLLMYIFPCICGKVVYANRYFFLSGLVLYPMLYDFTKDSKIPLYIVRILMIWSVVVAVQTLVVCSRLPYASRQADENVLYQLQGVGGYMFIYAITLASVMLFTYIVNNLNSNKSKWFLLVWILYILTIYKANFMTAVMISILGAVLGMLFKRTTLENRLLESLAVMILALIVFGPILSRLEILISMIIPETGRIAQIFSDSNGIINSISNEFGGDRLPVLKMSIHAISKAPLAGLIFSSKQIDFGQHSTFFDTFALWGIPMGIIYFWLILTPFFEKKRLRVYEYTVPILGSFLFLMIFNNIESTSAFVMCYLALFFVDNIRNKEKVVGENRYE